MAASISGSYGNYALNQTNSSSSTPGLFRSDFQQLSQALQSGNLSGAQTAYNNLEQLIPSGGQKNQFATALSAVGQALQSGNLSGAQSAFASLQQLIAAHRGSHIGVAGGAPSVGGTSAPDGDGDGGIEPSAAASAAATAATTAAAQAATNSLTQLNVVA